MAVVNAVAPPIRRMTEDEFMRLPDDGKYELVDGEARKVPTGCQHGAIIIHLAVTLTPYVRGRGFLMGSSAGCRMRSGNIRCPDISFTLKSRLTGGKLPLGFLPFSPDLAIEIISESEEPGDMARKVGEYFEAGAQQVWQLFPEARRVKVFRSPSDAVMLECNDELDGGELLPGFHCGVAELFELD